MTKADKILLIHFVTRTGMYINPVDINNIQSFITGYETGRKNRCHFSQLSKDLMSTKYKIKHLSDGWPGQIKKLSVKQPKSNIVTFKKIALETIALNGIDDEMKKTLKSRIIDHLSKIDKTGHPWYNETWIEYWYSLVSTDKKWFKQLWTKECWIVIKLIDKEVSTNNIFTDRDNKIPSNSMLKLKYRFDQINCT